MKPTTKTDLVPALARTDHRPYPMPTHNWVGRQRWLDLLFAHYPVSVADVRPLVPDALTIQEFEGTSWVGVVPFYMSGVRLRGLPDIPGLSAFPELNLRLYVEFEGKPGVWFVSLDTTNRLAVWTARRFFYLPYHYAKMQHRVDPDDVHFTATRTKAPGPINFRATYRPTGPLFQAQPGSLEHFLAERYCLYCQSPKGQLYRVDIQHAPWPLQHAEAEIDSSQLLASQGLATPTTSPHLLFSRGVDTVVWSPVRIARS